jgi:hypothetical protein
VEVCGQWEGGWGGGEGLVGDRPAQSLRYFLYVTLTPQIQSLIHILPDKKCPGFSDCNILIVWKSKWSEMGY